MDRIQCLQPVVISLCLILLVIPLLMWPDVARAQEPVTLRVDRVEDAAFPEITVHLTVRSAYGVPIADLTSDQFDVSEDRTLESRPISGLETTINPHQPIALLLVIDVSGSMAGEPLEDAQAAAVRLLDRLGPQDKAGLLAFADNVNLADPFPQLDPAREHDFTADKASLYDLVDNLTAGGNTPLYDAAYKAVHLVARQPAGNRAVLLLTDGRDEVAGGPRGSGSAVADEDTPIREANRAKVPVFTVGLGQDIDAPWLKRLALETGGTYQQTPDSAQLTRLFQNVLDLLKQQYRLTYTSGMPEDGADHGVLVSVKVGEDIAFDEATWGPAPLAPTETPPPPTATPDPTNTLSPTRTPTATATATPAASGPAGATGSLSPLVMAGGLGLLVLLGLGTAVGLARARRQAEPTTRCLNCGRALPEAGAPCPDCGFAGEYRDEDT